MADDLGHPIEALQDAVDGRLDETARAALDAHLAECERCRRELEALRLVKARLAAARTEEIPLDLNVRLRGALDDEDRSRRPTAQRPLVRIARWLAAAAAVVIAIWIVNQWRSPSVPRQAAEQLRAFATGALPLSLQSTDPGSLDAYFRRSGLPFQTRVFDFGMMNYQLAGGGVRQIANQPAALFAYRGPDGKVVLCQMYAGRIERLPAPPERRTNDGIEFLVYRESDVTVVVWQEGSVVCVLASNDDPETAIKLAFAKAIKV